MQKYKPNNSKGICSEFRVSKKKWICFSIYIGLDLREILKHSLKAMNEVISKALCKCENLIVMGDFGIDIKCSNSGKDNLQSFCDLFNLTNLAHSETCFMKNSNRSSRQEVFCKKGVLRNFQNSQDNTCARDTFLIKLQASGLQLY